MEFECLSLRCNCKFAHVGFIFGKCQLTYPSKNSKQFLCPLTSPDFSGNLRLSHKCLDFHQGTKSDTVGCVCVCESFGKEGKQSSTKWARKAVVHPRNLLVDAGSMS